MLMYVYYTDVIILGLHNCISFYYANVCYIMLM